jgi:YihY family inner membrane protein
MEFLDERIRRVDAYQRRHPWLGFPFAVVKRFGEDRAGSLAALIAYYGFFSLFPLLLVFVTVLGMVLRGNPDLQQSILHSALRQFPVIGDQIQRNVKSLSGSSVALAVGIIGSVWAGLGVTAAAQNAMNDIWDVKIKDRPGFLRSKVRGLITLGILGAITVAGAMLAGLGGGSTTASMGMRLLGLAGSIVTNFVLFLLVFKVLTEAQVSWGDIWPGAATASVFWVTLQAVGGFYVTHQLKHATQVYGTFALVIGLLSFIYLGAQLTLLSAEINVVRVRHLWPRSLKEPPLIEPDRRALTGQAEMEEQVEQEDVSVRFDGSAGHREEPAGD